MCDGHENGSLLVGRSHLRSIKVLQALYELGTLLGNLLQRVQSFLPACCAHALSQVPTLSATAVTGFISRQLWQKAGGVALRAVMAKPVRVVCRM